jgi:hypothetical protein
VAGVHRLGARGVLERVVVDELRRRRGAVRGIHIDAEVGVLLHQGLHAVGELVGVLRHVLRVDRQHGLLVGVRVGPRVAVLVAGGCLDQAAVPGGNGARFVAGLLRAHGRERGLELGGLVGADSGLRGSGGGGQQGGQQQ